MNITSEAVEAAARAFYNDPSGLTSWDRASRVSPQMAERYRVAMARALEAAAPHMLMGAWDDGHSAGVDHADGLSYAPNPYETTP